MKKQASNTNGFKSLNLSEEVYKGIQKMGFKNPTPVQRKALPVILTGADSVIMARTGSGKTAAFCLPLIEKLLSTKKGSVRAVILSPTRELSMQTLKVLGKLSTFTDIKAIGIHGGEGMEKQFNSLASKPDVIVATPGRLAHHLTEIPDFNLNDCFMCILDEADRLLEMGFSQQIRQISRTLPESCQKIMLSATMPKILIEFTRSGFCTDPQVVRLDQEATVSAELRIAFINSRTDDKDAALLHTMQHIKDDQQAHSETRTGLTLIFAATRHHVEYISVLLEASGYSPTLVYGTLDQEARKQNLADFRSGQKPIMVVTDVAARGIDVPLIDHVIHYHFPPSPKLFVHRSGRAARAGRIGFCWAFVDPEELPYMVDLHLFLGRKLSSGDSNSDEGKEEESYTLNDMTPDHVHFGSLPESILSQEVENVQRILNSEFTGSKEASSLHSLQRVCRNAMKQYRKTRPEASREGVRRAKAILEGERLETGQRVQGSTISVHPLLRGMELKYLLTQKGASGADSTNIEAFKEREKFLKAVSNYRPKETVFEAFHTGGGKDIGVMSILDHGRTSSTKKNTASAAMSAMQNMRRQMRIAHDKGSSLVVAGSNILDSQSHRDEPDSASKDEVERDTKDAVKGNDQKPIKVNNAKRLSRSQRKKLKKDSSTIHAHSETKTQANAKTVKKDFRDPVFYMENDLTSNAEEAYRSRQIENAMQPNAGTNSKSSKSAALRLEDAMLDVVGDENEDMVKKQRMVRWDKSKRKYVKTTVGEELSGESKTKKTRLESGQLMKDKKMKLGELYEKWQKKTNRSVGRNGIFDEDETERASAQHRRRNTKQSRGGNGMKTAVSIKKDREKKLQMRIKNMKKEDRKRYTQKQKGKNP